MKLTCRQCGRQFVFTQAEQEFYELKGFKHPSRCQECRTSKQSQLHELVCSQCGTELEKGAPIYCTTCLESVRLKSEQKSKQSQTAASAAHTKLLASESQKAELAELLRQREQLVAELEQKVNSLSQDLDKAYQAHAALQSLQPILNGLGEKLETLEQAHNITNQRMLQLVEKMHEMYENTSLLEIIKRNLKYYRKQPT